MQPDKSYFILAVIKEVGANVARNHWILMKDSEINNKRKNKYAKFKTILSIWSFKLKIFPYGILMKHRDTLCSHGGMQNGELTSGKPMLQWQIG